jgi:hypothetical protein
VRSWEMYSSLKRTTNTTLIPDDIGDGVIIMFDFEKVAEYMYEIGLLDVD